MRRVLTVVFCGLLSSAEAEVIGEYEWELRRIEDACLLATYSYTGNSKMQLHNIDGGVTAFIVLSPDLAGSLVDGEFIKAKVRCP